jgi:3-dehydroquinate synthetase
VTQRSSALTLTENSPAAQTVVVGGGTQPHNDAAPGGRDQFASADGIFETVVGFGDHRYDYFAGAGDAAWTRLKRELTGLEADRFVLITESSLPSDLVAVVAEHASQVAPVSTLSFSGGEPAKTVATLDALAGDALRAGVTRRSCVIAVGGGLAGNIAGLLSALLFRGIRLVHVPTTLLGMSDSVLSLKQAVNSQVGKNHVGTFHTPVFVWSNVDFLERLPVVERKAALCEVIKNVVAIRPSDHEEVAGLLNPSAQFTPEQYVRIIELAIDQKTAVMERDAYEKGEALVLEYGHTVGHALEVTMNGQLTHGLAIGIGMTVAAEVAHSMGVGEKRVDDLLQELLGRLGAPTTIPAQASTDELMHRVGLDNKRGYLSQTPGRHDMVLLEAPGRALWTADKPLTQAPAEVIRGAIDARRADAASGQVGRRARSITVRGTGPMMATTMPGTSEE